MYNSNLAYKGYATTSRETASEKQIELKVFSSITARMQKANADDPKGFVELANALHDNVSLWTILFTDMADDKNTLPDDLKAQIINLAEFTRKHTLKILSGTGKVDVLIDINKAIINGLQGKIQSGS